MPTIVSLDKFFRRPYKAKNYQDRRSESETRFALVTGLDNTNLDRETAIDDAVTAAGSTSPTDSTLELYSAIGRKFAPNKAIVELRYQRGQASIPVQTANAMTRRASGIWTFPWYRDQTSFDADGRPDGDIVFAPYADDLPEIERRPRAYSWQFGVTTLTMPTVLTSHPDISTITNVVGKINSNTTAQFLTVGAFPTKSLYFAGYRSTPVDRPGGIRFIVEYTVVYNPRKWIRMLPPVYNTSTPEWETTLVDAFEAVTFPTFSVHA